MNIKQHFHFLFLFSLLLLAGCSCTEDTNKELINRIEAYANRHPDGFTLDITTLQPVQKGYAVEYNLYDTSLPYIVTHALGHDKIVGGWLDPETDTFAYGSTRVYPENQLPEAVAFGLLHHQKAIYDLSNDSTIYLASLQP